MINRLSISNLPSVFFDGAYRVLGCKPSPANHGLPSFASVNATLDPSQWREIDLEFYSLEIKNQGMCSGCVGFGCSSALEMSILQGGRDYQTLSALFLYSLVNGGRDAGASISDALTALKQVGSCPENMAPPGAMFQNQFPATCRQAASRFEVLEGYHCGSFEEICTAITLGFPTPLGILVGNNFANLDQNGVAPLPNGGGGGHCLLGMGLKRINGQWCVKVQNSWGGNFGIAGHCYIVEGHFQNMQVDAFALQSPTEDPQGTSSDVPVVTT